MGVGNKKEALYRNDKLSESRYIHLVPLCFTLNGRFKCHLRLSTVLFHLFQGKRGKLIEPVSAAGLADATR